MINEKLKLRSLIESVQYMQSRDSEHTTINDGVLTVYDKDNDLYNLKIQTFDGNLHTSYLSDFKIVKELIGDELVEKHINCITDKYNINIIITNTPYEGIDYTIDVSKF